MRVARSIHVIIVIIRINMSLIGESVRDANGTLYLSAQFNVPTMSGGGYLFWFFLRRAHSW